MASYRHLSRTCVMQTLFAFEFREGEPSKILDQILDEFAPKMTEREFAHTLLNGVLDKSAEIVNIIQKYAPQWPIEKIAPIDRAILEIGVFEIVFSDEVPAVVAINEAVETAKHFGDENSPKFINGVLSTVMKENKKD